jgi:hypothetical protein
MLAQFTSPPTLSNISTTKHVGIDLHFVRERVTVGDVRVHHVPTTSQFIDIFTKGLLSLMSMEFWFILNICRD